MQINVAFRNRNVSNFLPMQYVKSKCGTLIQPPNVFFVEYWIVFTYSIFSLFNGNFVFFCLVTFAKLHTWLYNATTINEQNPKTKQNVILLFGEIYGFFGLFDTTTVNHQNSIFKFLWWKTNTNVFE